MLLPDNNFIHRYCRVYHNLCCWTFLLFLACRYNTQDIYGNFYWFWSSTLNSEFSVSWGLMILNIYLPVLIGHFCILSYEMTKSFVHIFRDGEVTLALRVSYLDTESNLSILYCCISAAYNWVILHTQKSRMLKYRKKVKESVGSKPKFWVSHQ